MLFLAVPNTDPTVDLGANGVLGLPLLDSTRQMKEFPLFASAHPASAPSASASANASAMAGAPAPPESATKAEAFASLSILLQIAMLMVAFVVGHILRRRKVYYIHEGSAALLIAPLSSPLNLPPSPTPSLPPSSFRRPSFLPSLPHPSLALPPPPRRCHCSDRTASVFPVATCAEPIFEAPKR
ncbi:hypothetical protein CLOM_g14632 [Closterium sp. NIES-68]|nr:hypothetical protein CLOM_g20346 [Closterium sp. NIES-68]GJP52441.1 hypothetical protein CLOM_g11554 [Closterium sp. NIES-68]GJP55694.1 hypothetical protein CLOM_g14632 [Closterium sp. NIES-68]